MAFQPVPAGISMVVKWHAAAQFAGINVLHFWNSNQPETDLSELQEVADWFTAWVVDVATYKPWATSVEPLTLSLRSMATQEAPFLEVTFPEGGEGSINSPRLPSNVTKAVNLLTGATGRSRRGRLYAVGMTEDTTVDDVITQAQGTNLLEFWDGFRSYMNQTNYNWAVLSRYSNGALRTEGVVNRITDVTLTNLRVNTKGKRVKAEL